MSFIFKTIRFAIPKKRAKYESPMVRLDGMPEQNSINEDFELQFSNPGFKSDDYENANYYTDFTGSREVGIDVGPDSDQIHLTSNKTTKTNPFKEDIDGLNNLKNIINEVELTEKNKSQSLCLKFKICIEQITMKI